MKKADLHMHSYFSDGKLSPEELVLKAKAAGLSCIALTDHDTVGGNPALIAAGRKHGFEVIPGVEISSDKGDIVGLFIDHENPVLRKVCEDMSERITQQVRKMLPLIVEQTGFDFTFEEVDSWNPHAPTVLQHLVEVLMDKGYVDDYWSFYVANIKPGGRFNIPVEHVPVEEAVKAVKAAGGLAIFAHPWLDDSEYLFNNIDRLIGLGLGGMEDETGELKPDNYEEVTGKIHELAEKYDLVITRGTDFHNEKIGADMGSVYCDYSVVDEIKRRLGKH